MSIQTAFECTIPTYHGDEVSVELGVVRLVTHSNGQFLEPVSPFEHHRKVFAKLQRRFKPKTHYSHNWKKLQLRIAKWHHKMANSPRNNLHQLTNNLCNNHEVITVEKWKVTNITKSANETKEEAGKNVVQIGTQPCNP